jgi:hypothetical protein
MLRYKPLCWLDFDELFAGRLSAYGVEEHVTSRTTRDCRLLVAGDAPLWARRCAKYGARFWRGGGAPLPFAIQEAIWCEFGVEVVSEKDYRYDGFASEAEREEAYQKLCETSRVSGEQ